MTNNPTIEGVSRDLLERLQVALSNSFCPEGFLLNELRALLDAAPHEHEWDINAEGTATVCYCGARSSDAPASERQEPVAPFYISADDWNLLVRGDVEIASVRVSRSRRSIFTESLFAHPSALQSTVAQLKARIGELESGRGEPVAWMVGAGVLNIKSEAEKYASGRIVTPLYNSSRNKELAACPDWWKIVPITPTTDMKRNGLADRHDGLAGDIYRAMLDVAPSPPFGENSSYSLPDRQSTRDSFECGGSAQEQFSMGWNACLDATAELNTTKPAEWHDVSGDDEGLVS